jgi:peptidyl-prolyl cis-trans isomerase B (cyclophilin B)
MDEQVSEPAPEDGASTSNPASPEDVARTYLSHHGPFQPQRIEVKSRRFRRRLKSPPLSHEETQASTRPPRSPEDVARQYLSQYGEFDEAAPRTGARARPWRRVIGDLIALVVIASAAVGGLYLANRVNRQPNSRTAQEQASADALAEKAGCPASPLTRVNNLRFAAAGSAIRPGTFYAATVATTAGTFHIALNSLGSPQALNSFVFLAEKGFYNCNVFVGVVPHATDLTGDPTGTKDGGPGYDLPAELPPVAADPADQYPLGSVLLANVGPQGSEGSQWLIVTGAQGQALPDKFTSFGRVTSGMGVLEKIGAEGTRSGTPAVTQRILKVTIQTRKV